MIAKKESEEQGILTHVARTLGAVAGTIASKASHAVGASAPAHPLQDETAKGKKSATPRQRASEIKKTKAARHKRKLGRRTGSQSEEGARRSRADSPRAAVLRHGMLFGG